MALNQKDLDAAVAKGCQVPDCTHDNHGEGLYLGGKCHKGKGVSVCYKDGVLKITCKECRAFIADVAVAV